MQSHQTAFIFPGQGSQSLGMGAELVKAYPIARQVYAEADELLGFPSLAWPGKVQKRISMIRSIPSQRC